jgi:UDP-N-acetylglucosamine--N-acetylmuramyl-(pentapeptide) pyrophosphoryl-undecaprenol N-acetylglucosamine transferase
VYPALAVLQALEHGSERLPNEDDRSLSSKQPASQPEEVQVLWIGGHGGMEVELVARAGIPFREIPAAGVHGVGLFSLPGNLWKLVRGTLAARRLIHDFKPQVMFFTGGYLAVPVAIANRFLNLPKDRAPILLFVPDIEPGLALKTLSRFADHIALVVAETRAHLSLRISTTITGYPTRQKLTHWDMDAARKVLGLSEELPVLLVSGGSKGARSINRALLGVLPELLKEMQVLHISGELDWSEVEVARSTLPDRLLDRYHVFPYLHDEMGAALTLADLVVSRAGASVLGEYPLFKLPAVLVPYPHAWRYQQVNADYLADHSAAIVIEDADLSTKILPVVQNLMRDPSHQKAMSLAMGALAHQQAAGSISLLLKRLAAGHIKKGT